MTPCAQSGKRRKVHAFGNFPDFALARDGKVAPLVRDSSRRHLKFGPDLSGNGIHSHTTTPT